MLRSVASASLCLTEHKILRNRKGMYVPGMFVLVPDLTWSEGKERKEGKGAGRKKCHIFINSREVTQTRSAAYLNRYNI